MIEELQPIRESASGGGGLGNLFDEDDSPGVARVASGLHDERLPVGNMTVGEIRARFRDRLDIDPQSEAAIDGLFVDDATTVRVGQHLIFMHRAGEKGGRAPCGLTRRDQ